VTGGSTVSASSAARFAARVRSRRRRRIAVVLAVVLLVVVAAGASLYSPWTTVRRISVSGTHRIDPASVTGLLADQRGRPLLLVDTGALQARVRALRLVAGVSVQRQWPGGLLVVVRERQAVAAVPSGAGVRLVDVDGVEVATAAKAPPGLPVVQVDLAKAGPGSLPAVLEVLKGLPPSLSTQVSAIGAGSPDSVWLTLVDGSRVLWGSSADTPNKAVVLSRLRVAAQLAGARGRGRQYDVSAPDAPAVSAPPTSG
jgi:cell division protein FtsQ